VKKLNISIRFAKETDFEQVGKIFSEENRFHAELVPEIIQVADPIMTPEWFDEVLKDPKKNIFVAENENRLLGLALVMLQSSIDDPIFKLRKYVHIGDISVLKEFQSLGIGRLLMEKIRQWTDEQGIKEIELQVWERNDKAIGFYEKLGYHKWRRTMRLTLDDRNK